MPRLMRGNAHGGKVVCAVNRIGKAYNVSPRVVVVGKIARNALYFNIIYTVCFKHPPRGVRSGKRRMMCAVL